MTGAPLPPPAGCTFNAEDWRVLSQHWYPVARAQDLGDKPVAVTLLDTPLVVYRTPQGVHVARDQCAHRGVPLSRGWVEGEELICRYHGLRYGPDGQCRHIPAHPEIKVSSRFRVPVFPVAERYGLVWTRLNAGDTQPPPFPVWEDAAYQTILPPFVDIAGSAGRQVEGFVDVAHFAWIHHEAFADRNDQVVPDYTTAITDFGLRTEYWSTVNNYPKGLEHLAPPGFRWLRAFEIYLPYTARLTVHFPNDGRLCILNAASPVSARKTRLFVPIARNFDREGPLEPVYAFNAQIFAEDQAIIECQQPAELPLDPQAEAHFPADRTSTAYRRLLAGMGLGRPAEKETPQ
jgi:vanillate O-demethylase monooxygenase subunit